MSGAASTNASGRYHLSNSLLSGGSKQVKGSSCVMNHDLENNNNNKYNLISNTKTANMAPHAAKDDGDLELDADVDEVTADSEFEDFSEEAAMMINMLKKRVTMYQEKADRMAKEASDERAQRMAADKQISQLKTELFNMDMVHKSEIQQIKAQMAQSNEEELEALRQHIARIEKDKFEIVRTLENKIKKLEEELRNNRLLSSMNQQKTNNNTPLSPSSLALTALRGSAAPAVDREEFDRLNAENRKLSEMLEQLEYALDEQIIKNREMAEERHRSEQTLLSLQRKMQAAEEEAKGREAALEKESLLLRNQMEELRTQLRLKEEENLAFVESRKLTQHDYMRLSQQIEDTQKEKTQQVKFLQQQLMELNEEHSALYNKFQTVQRDYQSIVEQFESYKKTSQLQTAELQEDTERLRKSADEFRAEAIQTRERIEQEKLAAQRKCDELLAQNRQLQSQLDQLSIANQQIQSVLDKEKESFSKAKQTLSQSLQEAQSRAVSLESQLNELRSEHERLRASFDSLAGEKDSLQQELADNRKRAKADVTRLEEERDRVIAELQEQREATQKHADECAALVAIRDKLNETIRELHDQNASQKKSMLEEISRMSETIEQVQEEKQQIISMQQEQITSLQEENTRLHENLQAVNQEKLAQYQSLHGVEAKMAQDISKLEEQCAQLTQQLESKKAAHERQIALIKDALRQEKENSEQRAQVIAQLQNDIEDLNQQHELALEREYALKQELEAVMRERKETEVELSAVRHQSAILEQDNEQLKRQLADLNEELDRRDHKHIENMRQMSASLEEETSARTKAINELEQTRKALQEKEVRLSTLETRTVPELEQRIQSVQQQYLLQMTQLDQLKNECNEWKERCEKLQRDVAALNGEIFKREAQEKLSREERQREHDQARSIERDRDQLMVIADSLRRANEHAKEELEATKKANDETVAKLKEQLAAKESEISSLLLRISDMERNEITLKTKSTRELSEMTDERNRVVSEMESLVNERQQLQKRIIGLEEQHDNKMRMMQESYRNLENQHNRLEVELESTKERFNTVERERKRLSEALEAAREKEKDLNASIDEAKEKLRESEQARIRERDSYLDTLDQWRQELESNNSSSSSVYVMLHASIVELQNGINATLVSAIARQEEIEQHLLVELNEQTSAQLHAMSTEIVQLLERCRTLSLRNEQLEAETIRRSEESDKMAEEARMLKEERRLLLHKQEMMDVQLRSLRERLKHREDQYEEEKRLHAAAVLHQQKALRDESDNLKAYRDDLQKQMEVLKKQRSELQDENTKLSATIHQLRLELSQAQAQSQSHSRLLQQEKDHASQYGAQVGELQRERAEMKARLEVLEKEREARIRLEQVAAELQKKAADLASQLARQSNELAQTKDTLAHKQREVEDTTREWQRLHQEVAKAGEERGQLQRMNSILEHQYADMKQAAESLSRDNDNLRSVMEQLQKENERLMLRLNFFTSSTSSSGGRNLSSTLDKDFDSSLVLQGEQEDTAAGRPHFVSPTATTTVSRLPLSPLSPRESSNAHFAAPQSSSSSRPPFRPAPQLTSPHPHQQQQQFSPTALRSPTSTPSRPAPSLPHRPPPPPPPSSVTSAPLSVSFASPLHQSMGSSTTTTTRSSDINNNSNRHPYYYNYS